MATNYFSFKSKTTVSEIREFLGNIKATDSRGYLLDKTLYDLCAEYPLHKNPHEIQAKICLIGRAYSASIERRTNKEKTQGDFYYDYVVPVVMESDIDDRLEKLKKYSSPDVTNIKEILSVHKCLEDLLGKVTERNNRSFVSKYLHFHFPNLFYLYDSYSEKALNSVITAKIDGIALPYDSDQTYAKYCYKLLFIQHHIAPSDLNFPREIDSFLQQKFYSEQI